MKRWRAHTGSDDAQFSVEIIPNPYTPPPLPPPAVGVSPAQFGAENGLRSGPS
jgi:hypothetical protein